MTYRKILSSPFSGRKRGSLRREKRYIFLHSIHQGEKIIGGPHSVPDLKMSAGYGVSGFHLTVIESVVLIPLILFCYSFPFSTLLKSLLNCTTQWGACCRNL